MTLYRYRTACDVRRSDRPTYRRWWDRKTQEQRVEQAQYAYPGGLVADRCVFGPRRLVLVGELDLPTMHAVISQAHSVTLWTLASVYGMDEYRYHSSAPEPTGWALDVRPIPVHRQDALQ